MTLQELLNSEMDLASLAALARQGLAWWLDELTAMLPPAWRDRLSSRPRTWIEPKAAGGWRVWRDGRPVEGPPGARPAPSDRRSRIGLLAPPGAVLLRETPAPRMTAADVRRMLSLDIDRLSPLAADLIHYDMEILERGEGEGSQRVMLGIIPRDGAARLLDRARADGFEPVALAAAAERDDLPPRFDFLPQVLRAEGQASGDRTRLYLWIAVGVLILANLGVLVGRDIIDVSRVQAIVDGQQPVVDAVMRLRRRVQTEEARRLDMLARGRRGDPLRMLNVLTQAAPAGAWVQHLEWNGQSLRIVGFKRSDIDLAAAIRGSGAFTNPRALAAEPVAGPTPVRPFDVTADARPEPQIGARPESRPAPRPAQEPRP
jgi:general secretion pathway protein L